MKSNYTIILFFAILSFSSCKENSSDKIAQNKIEKKSNINDNSNLGNSNSKSERENSIDLTKHGIANNSKNVLGGLKVGDVAPDFQLENEHGEIISLDKKLEEGPVLLVFYRADWCSFCRRHLAEFQDKIIDIKDSGLANVIAVSPQKKEYSLELSKKNSYTFPILYDENHQTMKDYKVFFHVTDKYNKYITEAKGKSIEVWNGDEEPVMPVPATYMIGVDKKIKYVHYDPNYRVRADVDKALSSIAI